MAKHTILGGKVHIYRRENSPNWQCSSFLAGRNHRTSTKTDSLSHAKEFAEDWYLGMRGKLRDGELHGEKTFADAARKFEAEYEILTEGERNERWVRDHFRRIKLHLIPFFGKMALSTINAGTVQEYRISRLTKSEDGSHCQVSLLSNPETSGWVAESSIEM
ncbi:MAG: hypothetical protein AAGL92_11700, partial [Pseudomonadota bacterium]